MLRMKFATSAAIAALISSSLACKDTAPNGCDKGTCGGSGAGPSSQSNGGYAGSGGSPVSSVVCPLPDGGEATRADVSSCTPPSGTVDGNYPCDMQNLVETVCLTCHDSGNLQPGVPFPLNSYAESQRSYAGEWIPQLMTVAWTSPVSHKETITCAQFITLTNWLDGCAQAGSATEICP